MTKRVVAVGVALVMVIGVLEFVSPGGADAAPVSKSLVGTCTGADAATNTLLGALGGNTLAVGFTVNADVPKTLNPGQSGVPISFQWNISLDVGLVNKAVGAGLTSLRIRNTTVDTAVSGPTSTTAVPGRPGEQTVTLAANTPAVVTQGPFTGTLDNVGQSGVVTYKTGAISFTITVSIGGERNLNIACNAPGLIASTPIKVPGSPDIVQPIEIPAAAGANVAVDVLGQYVTAGRTPLVPSSLKVIDGPGSIQNGQLVVTAGGAPSANSVTFEVCGVPVKVADAVAGTSEVQHLSLDKSGDLLKKSIGFTIKFGDQETRPIWTATPNVLGTGIFGGGPLAGGLPTTKMTNWVDQAAGFALWTDPVQPPAATIQTALEALAAIGAGNVVVSQTSAGEYDVAFRGALAQKNVPAVSVGDFYSNLPQENLDAIIKAASALSAGSAGPTTTTTIPAGLTPNDYILQLILSGRTDEAGNVLSGQILGGIDVTATLATITGLFPSKPAVTTPTDGVDPVVEQFQDLCSQGSVTVAVAAPPVPPAAVAAAVAFAPAASAPPPAANRCSVVRKSVRVRIKGTKRYRTVTRKVTVCRKAHVARKTLAKKTSSRRHTHRATVSARYRSVTTTRGTVRRGTVRRR